MAYPQGGLCAERLFHPLGWTAIQDSAWQKRLWSSSSSGYQEPQVLPQQVLPLPSSPSSSSSSLGREARRDL